MRIQDDERRAKTCKRRKMKRKRIGKRKGKEKEEDKNQKNGKGGKQTNKLI